MAGAAPFRPRISRPRSAFPKLNLDSVSGTTREGQRSSRTWSADGWSPPPRKAAKNTRAPLSLNDVQNKNAIADATQLRRFEDQMAGYGPFPDSRAARQRQRRAWNQIDQKLRAEEEDMERSLVYGLTTPRLSEKSAEQIKDAERRQKNRRRAETMAKTSSVHQPRPVTPIMAGSPPSGDVRTEPKRLPSGEIIDPQEHIARPSQASPYRHAVMPEKWVSTVSKPTRPPAKVKKADGREVEKHTASGKFGLDSQEAAMAVSLLFASVQDTNDGMLVPDAPPADEQVRPATPGGSIIGIPGYEYDRRPHTIDEVEQLRAAQVAAQEVGNYTLVAKLADQIMELASPEEYKALQKERSDAEAARALEKQQQLQEEARHKALEEARERKATEEKAAAAKALAAQLVRESAFAEQQQALLKEEQRRKLWQEKRPAPHPEHRHSHMWAAKPEAALRPAVWSSPPRKIALIES